MKLKKVLAGVCAAAVMTVPVYAAESTIADATFTTFWGWDGQSTAQGVQLSDTDTTITFHDVSNGTNNWDNAIFVLFDSTNGVMSNANDQGSYAEKLVCRVDNWAWNANGDKNTNLGDCTFTEGAITTNWDTFVADAQAGIDVTITAKVTDGVATAHLTTTNGMDYTVTAPGAKWIAIGGENCTLSNIKVVTADAAAPTTGDMAPVALIAVAALVAGCYMVSSRKKTA